MRAGQDLEGAPPPLVLEIAEGGPVGGAEQVPPFGRCCCPVFPEDRLRLRGRRPVTGAAALDRRVIQVGPHRHRQVSGQRPRGGGPHGQEVPRPGRMRSAGNVQHLQPDGYGRVFHFPVSAQAHLEVGEGGARRPRIGEHLEVPVDEPFVPQSPEHPPHRLHEIGVHGLVAVLEVHPPSDPAGRLLPFLGGYLHHPAAGLVELRYAQLFDLAGAGYAQPLLGLHLHREAVRVPAEAALHPEAPHRPVAGHDVFDDPGQDVPVMGAARSEGRPVVEGVLPPGGPHLHRSAESVGLVPAFQDAGVEGGEIQRRGNPPEIPAAGAAAPIGFCQALPPTTRPGRRNRSTPAAGESSLRPADRFSPCFTGSTRWKGEGFG